MLLYRARIILDCYCKSCFFLYIIFTDSDKKLIKQTNKKKKERKPESSPTALVYMAELTIHMRNFCTADLYTFSVIWLMFQTLTFVALILKKDRIGKTKHLSCCYISQWYCLYVICSLACSVTVSIW